MADGTSVVRGIYDAFGRGDVEAVLAALDEKVEWHEAEHSTYWGGGPFVGPQAVVEGLFARLGEDFDGFRVDIDRIVGAGDTVVAEGRYRADAAKSTGQPLDAQVAHVWDVRDGKVVRFQQYTDTWQFAERTGVTPQVAQR